MEKYLYDEKRGVIVLTAVGKPIPAGEVKKWIEGAEDFKDAEKIKGAIDFYYQSGSEFTKCCKLDNNKRIYDASSIDLNYNFV
jgi:hypothetical protein